MTTVYLNGELLPAEQAKISPLDRGFLYGDSVYEVLRVYRGRLFRLEAHVARLRESLAKMRIGFDAAAVREVPARLVASNGLGASDALVYLQVTRGVAPRRQHSFPDGAVPTVFGLAWAFEPAADWYDPGVAVVTFSDDRWARCDIKTTALVPNVLANQRAKEAGAGEGLFIRDGAVQEGTLSNFWAVFGGEVRTAPLTNTILPGVKRAVVLEACRANGVPVREAPIFQHELAAADEAFLSSTVHDIAPIRSIDGRALPKAHPVTDKVRALYRAAVNKECGLA